MFVLFLVITSRLFHQYKETGNRLAKYLGISFLLGGIEYAFLGVPMLFFPHEFVLLKITGIIAWIFVYFVLITAWTAVSYVYPKFPLKPLFVVLTFVFIGIIVYLVSPFVPAFINEAGIIDYADTPAMMVGGLLLTGTYLPMGLVFFYRAYKKKLYVKGITFGLGLVLNLIFLPISYQVNNYSTFVFFTVLAALGMTSIAIGVLLSSSAPTPQPQVQS